MSQIWIISSSAFNKQIEEKVKRLNAHRLDNFLYCNGDSLEIGIDETKLFFRDAHKNLRSSIRFKSISFPQLKELWEILSDILVDSDDCIEENFLWWSAGTDREYMWHWFDKQCHNNLHDDLMEE